MKGRIALLTVLADNVPTLANFYRDVLGFQVEQDLGEYVEFAHAGVRFAICARSVLASATHHPTYLELKRGQAFELAFPLETVEAVDETYAEITEKGATSIHEPYNTPWGQRAAFFADPEGNIHEIFADLK